MTTLDEAPADSRSVVPVTFRRRAPGRLNYHQARRSPCLECRESPCCTYLIVHQFEVESLGDLDFAEYLLNFDGILLGLHPEGPWSVFYHQPCRHLDVTSGLCTVHRSELQPSICVHYNAHTCSYRHVMTQNAYDKEVVVDRRRLSWLRERVVFDDQRKVLGGADWQEMLEAFADMPVEGGAATGPEADPVYEAWRTRARSGAGDRHDKPRPRHFRDPVVSDPCTGCEAWCCSTLVFARPAPQTASHLDFLRYVLGFPGVEVAVGSEAWSIVVKTRCRHLDGGRCAVYGTDERPLHCDYLDPLQCAYRANFGTPEPLEITRVRYEHFPVLAEAISFDDHGRVRAVPGPRVLRGALEDQERHEAGVDA